MFLKFYIYRQGLIFNILFQTCIYSKDIEQHVLFMKDRGTGSICLDILRSQWSPALTISKGNEYNEVCQILHTQGSPHLVKKQGDKKYMYVARLYQITSPDFPLKYPTILQTQNM
jgi:hypothetical protein